MGIREFSYGVTDIVLSKVFVFNFYGVDYIVAIENINISNFFG